MKPEMEFGPNKFSRVLDHMIVRSSLGSVGFFVKEDDPFQLGVSFLLLSSRSFFCDDQKPLEFGNFYVEFAGVDT